MSPTVKTCGLAPVNVITGASISSAGVTSHSPTFLTETALALAYCQLSSLRSAIYEVVSVATNVNVSTTFVPPVTISDDAITPDASFRGTAPLTVT